MTDLPPQMIYLQVNQHGTKAGEWLSVYCMYNVCGGEDKGEPRMYLAYDVHGRICVAHLFDQPCLGVANLTCAGEHGMIRIYM